jgi:hypothetical protein
VIERFRIPLTIQLQRIIREASIVILAQSKDLFFYRQSAIADAEFLILLRYFLIQTWLTITKQQL